MVAFGDWLGRCSGYRRGASRSKRRVHPIPRARAAINRVGSLAKSRESLPRKDVGSMPMMMGEFGYWWLFPIGGVLGGAMVAWFLEGHPHRSSTLLSQDPLAVARERYAQGLISKSELDQLVQDLLNMDPHER